ncbi:MAG: sulfotransferase [Rhodopila sp.]|nr:sulfotransferase [Rhodopila sp.]
MAGSGSKMAIAPGSALSKLLQSGPLTEAGRIPDQFSHIPRPPLPENPAPARQATPPPAVGGARAPAAGPRPSRARVQAAHRQAVLGIGLAKTGKHDQAIAAFRRSIDLDPTVASVRHDLGFVCLEAGRLDEAAEALTHAVRLAPNLASAHLNLATALDHLGRIPEARAAYEAVIRLMPGNHVVRSRLGQIYLGQGLRLEAATAWRAAAAAAGPSVQATIYNAQAEKIAGRPVEAEALLRAAIAADPNGADAHIALGQSLAETGRSQEAGASFETGLALDPRQVNAWYPLAMTRKFTGADQPLIDRMLACLAHPRLTPALRKSVHFALGKVHDDLGDYALAMHHFDAANQVRGMAGRLDRALLARQTAQVIAQAPPGFLERRQDLGVEDATPILIVGMPRSGTTLVEQILSSHPDVAAGGELGFWHEGKRGAVGTFDAMAKPDVAHRLAGDYLAVLRAISPASARVTDKMPFNFARLGLIRQLFPRATIVHCRRHPVDVCLSIFTTNFESSFDFASDRGSLAFFYGEYRKLMAHWRHVLPSDRFIEVQYEDLVADPEPLTRRLIEACGLEWNDACLAPHLNQRQIATASLWQARQPIYRTSVARWRRYEPWLGELRSLMSAGD